jgi:hypothetical protein
MSAPLQAEKHDGRYRAVSPTAVVSLVCGVASSITFLSWYLAVVPALGIVLGRVAVLQIRVRPTELAGRSLAWTGAILSAVFWVGGYGWLTFEQVREAPWGYTELKYEDLQPDPKNPGEKVPPAVYKYDEDGTKVYIRGYMQEGRQWMGLTSFYLCPEVANCPYCIPKPKRTEIIVVELQGDMKTDYTTHPIGVGGRLRVDPDMPGGLPYKIEADVLR